MVTATKMTLAQANEIWQACHEQRDPAGLELAWKNTTRQEREEARRVRFEAIEANWEEMVDRGMIH
jgi:hypothetical protein